MNTKKTRIALVGLGRVGLKHLKAIFSLNKHLELVALIDPKSEQLKKNLVAQFPDLKTVPFYSAMHEIPEEASPDIFSIATPSHLHFQQAFEALNKNAHLLLEKPMCMRLNECQTLENLAKEKNKHILMGHIYRYFPMVHELKQDIKNQIYGTLLHASIKVCSGHSQAYYDLASWRGTWEKDGGALLNQSIHAVDLMCYLLSQSPVQCRANLSQVSHSMEAEDLGFVVYTLEQGQHLDLLGTTATDENSPYADFDLIFTQGRIHVSWLKHKIKLDVFHKDKARSTAFYYKKALQSLWKKDALQDGFLTHLKALKNPHQAIYAELLTLLRFPNYPARTSARVGKEACASIFAAYLSAKQKGETVHLPLEDFDTLAMRGYFENLKEN